MSAEIERLKGALFYMAFRESLENFRDLAAEAAQNAAKTTRKLAEIAKANLSIYSEEDKIKKAYAELGKLYYRDYVVGEELDEAEYLPWCRKIDESKETIADLRDYIEVLKTERVVYEAAADDVTEADFAEEAEETAEAAE
jgi:hypothetical protein